MFLKGSIVKLLPMSVLELGQSRGDIKTPLLYPEVSEPTYLFPLVAARFLATDFLINRPREQWLKVETISEDAYVKGRMDVRATVLTMIGQVHVLALDPNKIDINKPPLIDIKPISQSQIDMLLNTYRESYLYLAEQKFDSKPIKKISPAEAYAKGRVMELGKALTNLGQKLDIAAMSERSHVSPGVANFAEVQ